MNAVHIQLSCSERGGKPTTVREHIFINKNCYFLCKTFHLAYFFVSHGDRYWQLATLVQVYVYWSV